jgi:hypothetical protein
MYIFLLLRKSHACDRKVTSFVISILSFIGLLKKSFNSGTLVLLKRGKKEHYLCNIVCFCLKERKIRINNFCLVENFHFCSNQVISSTRPLNLTPSINELLNKFHLFHFKLRPWDNPIKIFFVLNKEKKSPELLIIISI